jgi:hypothetical protein
MIHPATDNAMNTSRPIPSPSGVVIPGARNFRGVSMKLSPRMRPIQVAGMTIRSGIHRRDMLPRYRR